MYLRDCIRLKSNELLIIWQIVYKFQQNRSHSPVSELQILNKHQQKKNNFSMQY